MSGSALRGPFQTLSALAMGKATTPEQLAHALRKAEGLQKRHRTAEGLVYAQACDRYRRLTGTEWRKAAAADATWSSSDHRYRERNVEGVGYIGQCSCGVGQPEPTGPIERMDWHAVHVAEAVVAEAADA